MQKLLFNSSSAINNPFKSLFEKGNFFAEPLPHSSVVGGRENTYDFLPF